MASFILCYFWCCFFLLLLLCCLACSVLIGSCSRSDYYLMEAEMYERSGGRRSSLYEGDNNDPASEFNRSAYGFNTSRSVFVKHNHEKHTHIHIKQKSYQFLYGLFLFQLFRSTLSCLSLFFPYRLLSFEPFCTILIASLPFLKDYFLSILMAKSPARSLTVLLSNWTYVSFCHSVSHSHRLVN